MAFEVGAHARRCSSRARRSAASLPRRIGLEMRAVIAGGARILEQIERVGGDVFRRRPVLRRRDWALLRCASALTPTRARVATRP